MTGHVQGPVEDLTFRRAEPADAAALVPLMRDSSRRLIDGCFAVGKADPDELLRRDFLRGDGIYGYRNQWVLAGADGTPVATLTAYPGDAYGRLLRATLLTAARYFSPLTLVRVLWRSSMIGRLFTAPRHDGVFVANGCVAPHLRSRGLFARLLECTVQAVATERTRAAELDVSFDNPRAQALYERLGWVVTHERSRGQGDALIGFRRMVLSPVAPRGGLSRPAVPIIFESDRSSASR